MLLATDAATEDDIVTAWYSFDRDSDVNLSSPFIIDKSSSANNLISISGSGTYSSDTDTGLESGTSLRINQVGISNAGSPITPNEPLDKLTIGTWVKFEDISSGNNWLAQLLPSSRVEVGSNGSVSFVTNLGADAVTTASGFIENNKWHYLIVSYGNGNTKIWIDGELVANDNSIGTVDFQGLISIGAPSSLNFNGWLDELIISNMAFDGEQFF